MENNKNDILLNIEDLYVQYDTSEGTAYAVNGISFTIKRGETFGLVGETGAGKTTTALSILKLLPQKVGNIHSGKIEFEGEDLIQYSEDDMRSIRGSHISMIFQDPMTSLNPVLTVGDQIAESIETHHPDLSVDDVEDRVDNVLQLVGIPPSRKYEYPHQFSGGMKQRVVIAMALVCDPMLLLADEPTTALDVTVQDQVLDMMSDLKKEFNTSMIMITHDLGIVCQMCDNVAIMYAGEIIEIGSVFDIFNFEKGHHPYTKGLFGSLPSLQGDSKRLKPVDGLMPDPMDLPKGCKFHPRCEHCMEVCKTEIPEAFTDGTHSIKCHLYDKTKAGEM
ncbi:peptide/nickel transport system ATP-binding protein [Clostridiales Family XIII bacterium PM5-7]